MHDVQRRGLVNSIVRDLQVLDSEEFERLCYLLLSSREPGLTILHRGQTLTGKPARGDIDAFDASRTICMESSSAEDYFKKVKRRYQKPLHDLRHVHQKCPGARRIFLLSNRNLSNTDQSDLLQQVEAEASKIFGAPCRSQLGMPPFGEATSPKEHIEVHICSVRELSEALVETLEIRPDTSHSFSFVPGVNDFLATFIFENVLPPMPMSFVGRNIELHEITARLSRIKVAVISGISGIGKTWLLLKLAHSSFAQWNEIIWLDGSTLPSPPNFAALTIDRAGRKINLLSRLRHRRVLVAIDNFSPSQEAQSQLIKAFLSITNDTSRMVVSTQSADPASPYTTQLEGLSFDETSLLFQDHTDLAKELYSRTKGYPLLLRIIRRMVDDGITTSQNVLSELDFLPDLETEGQTLVQRLLSKHIPVVRRELEAIRWCGVLSVDRILLTHLIGRSGLHKLISRSFLTSFDDDTFVVHDTVFSCISANIHISDERSEELSRRFFRYVNSFLMERPYHLVRNITMFRDRIEASALAVRRPSIEVRAFLELKPTGHEGLILELSETPFQSNWGWPEITTVIESMEARLDQRANAKSRSRLSRKFADRLRDAYSLYAKSAKPIRSALELHAGKLYFWANETARAKHHLESSLHVEPTLMQARLQLARLQVHTNTREAAAHLEHILRHSQSTTESNRSVTTLLAAYAELRNDAFREIRDLYLFRTPDGFLRTMKNALRTGSPQPLKVLAELTGALSYAEPQLALQILGDVDIAEPKPDDVEGTHAYSRVLMAKAKALRQANDPEGALEVSQIALSCLQRLSVDSPFDKQELAKAYEAVGDFSGALSVAKSVPRERRSPFLWLAIARCEQALETPEIALRSINSGMHLLEERHRVYRAAFLERRAMILIDLGRHVEALHDIESALSQDALDPKHRAQIEQLRERIDRAKGEVPTRHE